MSFEELQREAYATGLRPLEFYDLLPSEVFDWIEAQQEARKRGILDRVSAIGRAFSKDPFDGLIEKASEKVVNFKDAAQTVFWQRVNRDSD